MVANFPRLSKTDLLEGKLVVELWEPTSDSGADPLQWEWPSSPCLTVARITVILRCAWSGQDVLSSRLTARCYGFETFFLPRSVIGAVLQERCGERGRVMMQSGG